MSLTSTDYAQQSNFLWRMTNNVKEVEFRVVGWSGGGVSLSSIDLEWQSGITKRPGGTATFNDLTLTVLLDEGFKSYEEAYEFIKLFKDHETSVIGDWEQNAFNGILMTTDNRNRFNKVFEFKDCWFSSISDLQFMSSQSSTTTMTFDITVVFDWYEIRDET